MQVPQEENTIKKRVLQERDDGGDDDVSVEDEDEPTPSPSVVS